MSTLVLNRDVLVLHWYERFSSIVEREREDHTRKVEAAKEERMEHHREQFHARVHPQQITEDITETGIHKALNTLKMAAQTGKLGPKE